MPFGRQRARTFGASNQSGTGWGSPNITVGGGGGGGTTVDAVIQRFDGSSGSVLVSNAIPLPPTGSLAMSEADIAANKGTVLVGGVERQIHLSATRARHPNGSVASVLVQFTETIPDASPIVAQFIPQQVRTLSTLTLTTVTQAMAAGRAALLPSSAAYLCTTDCTLQPLVDASQFTAEETAWFATWFANVQDTMDVAWNNNEGTGATYQVARGYLAHWCVTGQAASWYKAMRLIDRWYTGICSSTAPGETLGMFKFDIGLGYLLSGYLPYWTHTATVTIGYGGISGGDGLIYGTRSNAITPAYNNATGHAGAIGPSEGARYNMRYMFAALAAQRIDAKSNSLTSAGWGGPTAPVFATQWPWRIDALETNAYAVGDYRNGLVGQYSAYRDPVDGTDKHPVFWLSITNAFLRDYYHNVVADSRIPGMVKANFDLMTGQVLTVTSGPNYTNGSRHGLPYYMDNTSAPTIETPDTVLFTMFAADAAFLSRFYPSDSVNGATYLTWYTRLIVPGNIDEANNLAYNRWKNFGEAMGWTFSAPFHRLASSYSPPSTIREPTSY